MFNKDISNKMRANFYIQMKTTKLYAPQYLMTLIVMPFSYLAVSMLSGKMNINTGLSSFLFTSALSFYLSLVSTGIAGLFKAEIMESYASLNTSIYLVVRSTRLYFSLIYLISFISVILFGVCQGVNYFWYLAPIVFVLVSFFLSRISAIIGLIFRNPYRGGALIPYFVFIVLALTPLNSISNLDKFDLVLLNPFYDVYLLIHSLFNGFSNIYGYMSICGYLLVLSLIVEFIIYKKCAGTYVLEKMF